MHDAANEGFRHFGRAKWAIAAALLSGTACASGVRTIDPHDASSPLRLEQAIVLPA